MYDPDPVKEIIVLLPEVDVEYVPVTVPEYFEVGTDKMTIPEPPEPAA